jgi:hypothetical protein
MKLLKNILSLALLMNSFGLIAYAGDLEDREVKVKEAVSSYFGAERVDAEVKKLEEALPDEALKASFTALKGHIGAIKDYSRQSLASVDDLAQLTTAGVAAQSRVVLAKLALSRLQLAAASSGALTEELKASIVAIAKSLTDLVVVVTPS